MLEAIPFATAKLPLGEFTNIGATPRGQRIIAEIVNARFDGERFSASQVGSAAADWALARPDGVVEIDVRMSLKTDDGALVFLRYDGFNDPSERGQQAALSVMRFETADERYLWINRMLAVGKGEFTGDAVSYEIFELR